MRRIVLSIMALSVTSPAVAVTVMTPSVKLGSYGLGMSYAETERITRESGGRLQAVTHTPRFTSYVILDIENKTSGSISFCDGRVNSLISNVRSYDAFAGVLRRRIVEWGQPKILFDTVSTPDGSQDFEKVNYLWPAHDYKLSFDADAAQGMSGVQAVGIGSRCQ